MTISGVISRQVLPACGSLCFFCPGMRTRSRQPVKRYKKLIADIFPRNQEDGPNERQIGKLCEYASKNPLRIPKITNTLEQRCYKELRNENFKSAKIVMIIYRKLLVSCKEQLPLFASSLLSIMHTLLDQTSQDELQIVGCEVIFDFIHNQKDGTYMFNLEGFIPKLCQLAQEVGEEQRVSALRRAGLQALSSMIWYMGEFSHISVEFDNVVSVVLENYGDSKKKKENSDEGIQNTWVQEVHKDEGHVSRRSEVIQKVPSWKLIINEKGELNTTVEEAKSPCFWSKVCLHNMAKLGKEATTTRRVLESLFRYFDNGEFWSMEQGLAFPVLKDMQFLMDSSGQNTHVLLSMLIKHLDHRNVLKKPNMQLDIVEVTTSLAQLAKVENSVAIIGAVNDLMRHLRRSIHCSLDDANLGVEVKKWNTSLREAVDKCLIEVSHKVGDAGQVLEVMAVMLENISTITVIARTTVSAVYRTAQIIAPIPNLLYQNKTFPEALFHQLLPVMDHPDHETRVGAHRIFAVVLLPSSVSPRPTTITTDLKKSSELMRTLSRTVSVFSASAALFEKLKKDKPAVRNAAGQEMNKNMDAEGEKTSQGMLGRLKSSYSRTYNSNTDLPPVAEDDTSKAVDKEMEAGVRLSSRQISLLLSSIWSQSISPANNPDNYEAIAHTYSLVVLFSRYKNSSNEVLIRSFQLAFSLRSVALNEGGSLPPSNRRSLFTLATSMILFSSNAFNIAPLVSSTKVFLTQKLVDPYLVLVEDRKLQAVNTAVNHPAIVFGSKEDDAAAQSSLSQIDIIGEQSRESCTAEIINSLSNSSESELAIIREQLLNEFLPDDVCPMGAQLLNDVARKSGQVIPKDDSHTEARSSSIADDACLDFFEAQTKPNMQLAKHNPNLLSVNQLLDSVLESGNQVGRLSVSAPDVPYKEVALLCESLQMGKQMKISHVMSTQTQQEDPINSSEPNNGDVGIKASNGNPFLDDDFSGNSQLQLVPADKLLSATEYQHDPNTFRLPAASPYDNFLKAAGC